MPNTNTISSGEEDSLSDEAIFEINGIVWWYKEDMPEGMDAADAQRRLDLVTQWYKWCDRKYPGTEAQDWSHMASAAGEDVDIRLLIRGHSIAGYAILLFLEICFDVDNAFCGTDVEALAKVKMWHIPHEMKAYKYLISAEMTRWWATELSKLEDEIKSRSANRVSLSWRIAELRRCLVRLQVVMECGEGIWTNIWTSIQENGSEPPGSLYNAINSRVEALETSLQILSKFLERSQQGDVTSDIVPSGSHRLVELGGIRRRIPRADSPSINEVDRPVVQTSTVYEENTTPTSGVTLLIRSDSPRGATQRTRGLQHLQSLFTFAMNRVEMFIIRYKTNGILSWLIHRETAFVVSLCCVVVSAFFMTKSAVLANSQPATSGENSPGSDPNFLGNLSQSILCNLSIYLVIATTVHNQSEGLRYQSWLWLCLGASFLSSVLGLSLYSAIPLASTVFLWAAAFAQVVIPGLLIIKTGASEAAGENDVEHYGG